MKPKMGLLQHFDQKKSSAIHLYKKGAFFVAIDDQANLLSELFQFHIRPFSPNSERKMVGFPVLSISKYYPLLLEHKLSVKIFLKIEDEWIENSYEDTLDYLRVSKNKKTDSLNKVESQVVEKLKTIQIESLTALEAINVLAKLQKMIR